MFVTLKLYVNWSELHPATMSSATICHRRRRQPLEHVWLGGIWNGWSINVNLASSVQDPKCYHQAQTPTPSQQHPKRRPPAPCGRLSNRAQRLATRLDFRPPPLFARPNGLQFKLPTSLGEVQRSPVTWTPQVAAARSVLKHKRRLQINPTPKRHGSCTGSSSYYADLV